MRRLMPALSFLIAACGGGGGPESASPPPPPPPPPSAPASVSKVYALTDPGDSTASLDTLAANAAVDGLAWRSAWSRLEPQNGVYEWSSLDAALDVVRARGKKLTLHVGTGSGGTPAWLASQGVVTYTYVAPNGQSVTDPLPWDPVYLARYARFLDAMAAHLRSRGDVALLNAVSNGVPVSEMSLPGCRNAMLSATIAYSRASYLDAWKSTTNAHASAFAGVPIAISAPVGVICLPDNDGKAFYSELMSYALARGGVYAIFAADLNAEGSARLAQVDAAIAARAPVLFQMIWFSAGDPQNRMRGTLEQAVCRGLAAGGRYFEIYKVDLASDDPGIRAAISRARSAQAC